MNNLIEETLDDGSIVVVSRQSIDVEMESEPDFMMTPRFVPGMQESQLILDSPHKQLQDILKENNELRDSLYKNNTEMRQLLGAFRDYQDKTLQSRALHKQKIDEIWKDSQVLQQEKVNISQDNTDLQNQLKLKDLDIEKLQKDLSDVQNCCSGFESELSALKEDLKRSEVMILTVTSQMKEQESEVATLKQEKENVSNQNEALIEQLNKQNLAAMNRVITPDTEDMGFSFVNKPEPGGGSAETSLKRRLEQEETRCKELNQVICQQKEQIDNLEKTLTESRTEPSSIQSAEVAERFFQIQKLSKLNPTTSIFQECEDRYQSLGQHLGACEERLQYLKLEDSSTAFQEGLKREVEVLKQLLEEERLEKVKEKKIMEERIEHLTVNYRQILASWEFYESDQKTMGRQNEAMYEIEKRQHQEQLDELMAKNVSLEEEVQAKDNELSRLKGHISMLNTETEQMPILRAQVEVYRQDFTKEREERTKAEAAVSQLKQEVGTLQSQVSELTEELSALHNQQRHELSFNHHSGSFQHTAIEEPPSPPSLLKDYVVPRGHRLGRQIRIPPDDDRDTSRRRRSHQDRRSSPPSIQDHYAAMGTQNTFECPRCKMTFDSVTDVQIHLEACLSEEGPYS